jgi:uncharacterized membrane protein YesL
MLCVHLNFGTRTKPYVQVDSRLLFARLPRRIIKIISFLSLLLSTLPSTFPIVSISIVGFDYACIMMFTYEMVRNVRET